ncbi:cuticle protein LPCP-23 [Drosophila novamexicana]|uniref:cuticle protein LPCP-23 n=1 Tax=Drosophila novamexicana TaxID=47314 RepID=UPI0011E58AD8|nr:cuticle protein LPCP-23 [Drosophila novamexicana]
MAFKYVLLSFCALLGLASAGFLAPAPATYVAQPHYDAVGTTQQNVVRSFGGTVSTYSKNVVTPYSSVSKVDSRTTNNVYTPKTVYSAPAAVVTKSVYAAPAVTYAAPAPVLAKTVSYAAPAPVLAKTVSYAAPAVTYAAHSPVIAKTYAAPAVAYAAPAAAPTAYVKYSPAIGVAHVSFDGFGSHWGY